MKYKLGEQGLISCIQLSRITASRQVPLGKIPSVHIVCLLFLTPPNHTLIAIVSAGPLSSHVMLLLQISPGSWSPGSS